MIKLAVTLGVCILLLTGCGRSSKTPQIICQSSQIPKGWLVTSFTKSAQCGDSNSESNAYEIRNYIDQPVNAEMDICSPPTMDAPSGWVVAARKSGSQCYGVGDYPNILTIRRVN